MARRANTLPTGPPRGGGGQRQGPSTPRQTPTSGKPVGGKGKPIPAPPITVPVSGKPVPGGRILPPSANVGVSTGTNGSSFDQNPSFASLMKELSTMSGANQDAFAALDTLFNSYGLGSLAPDIVNFLQQGFSSDTITSLLQLTPAYEARFSGNQARIKNGLQVLTPAEYLATEASYRQILQTAGLDPAFATSSQYSEWIGKDIAPTEIQNRVNLAVDATTNAPPELTSAFGQIGVNVGDLASYFLNDKTPMPLLQQKMSQAQIIEAGLQSGVAAPSVSGALQYAKEGLTYSQAQSGYQKVADVLGNANQLTDIYKQQNPYGQTQAEQEFLGNSGTAQLARENLGRQETATFEGQGGVGQKSFAQQTAGTGF